MAASKANVNKVPSKVLIVDDEPTNVLLLEHILKKEGYDVDSAENGRQAIEKVNAEVFDIVLLDLLMPEMDGFEVITRMKEDEATRNIPIIIISADNEPSSYTRGIELGALDFFGKPFNRYELTIKIRNYLKINSLESSLRKELSARKQAEAELIKSERRLKMAMDVGRAGVYEYIYSTHSEMYFSRRFAEILGVKREEIPGGEDFHTWYLSRIHPDDLPLFNQQNDAFINGDSDEFKLEFRIRKGKKGNYVYIQDIARAISRNEKGEISRLIGLLMDISDRKKSEQQLKESEEKFHTIFLTSPEIISIERMTDGACVDVNKAFESIFGLSREKVLGRSINDLNIWSDIEIRDKIIAEVKNKGSIEKIETVFLDAQGNEFTVLLSSVALQLNGEPHILSVATNIEDLKMIQKSLIENETKYRLLADYNYDWEYWINPESRYIYVSPSCKRITGYSAAEFIYNPGLLEEIVHPDFKDQVQQHFNHIDESEHHIFDFKIIDKSGKEKWINHHCTAVYDDKGNFLGRRGNNRDVTEKREAEQEIHKLSIAIEQTSSGICITDTEGKIEYANPFYEEMTGFSEAEVIGKDFSFIRSEKNDPGLFKALWETISSGKVWQGEIINQRKNKEEFIVYSIITPVKDEKNTIINYIAVNQDITEQKIAANALQERELNFRNIFNHSSEGILISSMDLKVIDANASLLKKFGYPADMIGRIGTMELVCEDDRELVLERISRLSKGDTLPPVKIRGVTESGDLIPTEINSTVIDYSGQKAILTMVRDITEQEEIKKKILNTIVETEEKERSRFATDLHDGLGPLLSTTKLYIKALDSITDENQKAVAIKNSMVAIDEAIATIREIADNLSPHILRNFGLASALKTYAKKINQTDAITLTVNAAVNERLPENIELSLFRVLIELINNTIKYAGAGAASIDLAVVEGNVAIEYTDDGKGFDVDHKLEEPTGRGLQNIVNRINSLNGTVKFESEKGKGMRVKISI